MGSSIGPSYFLPADPFRPLNTLSLPHSKQALQLCASTGLYTLLLMDLVSNQVALCTQTGDVLGQLVQGARSALGIFNWNELGVRQ